MHLRITGGQWPRERRTDISAEGSRRHAPDRIPPKRRHAQFSGTPLGMALIMTALDSVQRFGGAAELTGDVFRIVGLAPKDFLM